MFLRKSKWNVWFKWVIYSISFKWNIYIIYNSVLTCRQNIINSSASASLNATEIAVKKVSDVAVCMFGPELQFSMYECCFLACFCASQRIQRRKAELTLALIRGKLPNGWADWHKIWHTYANSYGNGYTPNKLPLETQGGHLGRF